MEIERVQSVSLGTIPCREKQRRFINRPRSWSMYLYIHHFNASASNPFVNPRVYEALASWALVVSEPRPELTEVFPELPTSRIFIRLRKHFVDCWLIQRLTRKLTQTKSPTTDWTFLRRPFE